MIDLKHINVARARTPVRVDPYTIDVERAVVARALENAFGRNEFERATGWTSRAKARNAAQGSFPQVDGAEHTLWVWVPDVPATVNNLEKPRRSIVGQGVKRGHADEAAIVGLTQYRVENDNHAGSDRNNAGNPTHQDRC